MKNDKNVKSSHNVSASRETSDVGVCNFSLRKLAVLSIFLLTIPLAGAGSARSSEFPISHQQKCDVDEPIKVIGGSFVHFCAFVNEENADKLEKVLASRSIEGLVIDTFGGETRAGIKIGRLVHEYRLPVYVNDLCFSACAQWIVPASPKLYFREYSIIGLHHTQNSLNLIAPYNVTPKLRELAMMEREYYTYLGVAHQYLYEPLQTLSPSCIAESGKFEGGLTGVSVKMSKAYWMPSTDYFRSLVTGSFETPYPSRDSKNPQFLRIKKQWLVDTESEVSTTTLDALQDCD